MLYKFIIFCFFLFPTFAAKNHPFYISVFEANFKTADKELGVSCKIFPDDLEATLKQFSKRNIDLSSSNRDDNNKIIESYIRKHIGIKINGISKPYRYPGYENDNEATWIYFSISSLMNVKSIEITSDMMYEYKEEQTNIIHITIDGKRSSFKLNYPDKIAFAKKL